MASLHDIEQLFQGTVTVGARGQIVIPVRAREICSIQPGDKLLAFTHPGGVGVILAKLEAMVRVSSLLSQLLEEMADGAISEQEVERT